MKLKIAVVDDDHNQREFLAGLAASWAERMRHLAGIRKYADAEAFLFDYGEEKDFDILLLDVEMPQMSGVELAKNIRLENKTLQIVFVTGYYEYFGDGFDEIVGDKTAIYISHRLSSCRLCDRILVFHEGRIVQSGTHQELLSDESGKYYDLWHAQAQYYA